MLSPTPAPLGSRRRVFGAQHRSATDVSTIRFCLPATRPPEGAYGAGRPHAPGRRGHPHPTQCSELPTGGVAPGHRGENAQAPEHRGDARAGQPGPGLRGCRLGGGARGERGGAARYRPRRSSGGRGGAAGSARKQSAGRADRVMLLHSGRVARRRVMLEVNASAECLDAVVAVLPSMRRATVAPLFGNGGYAVKAAVPRDPLPQVIPAVKAAGGTDVVVSTLSQIVP